MAKLTYGLQQSLDGYVDHMRLGPPGPLVSRHFTEQVRGLAGFLYGRRTYDIMRYWDDDQPDWDEADHEFAGLWRDRKKWVVSRALTSLGPNATRLEGDLKTAVGALKGGHAGEIAVAGPDLAASLGAFGLIDEYRLYLRPVVLGGGTPFFTGSRPPLRVVASDLLGEDVVSLTYIPA